MTHPEILKCLMAEMRAATFAILQCWCLNVDLLKLRRVWTIQTIIGRYHEAETVGDCHGLCARALAWSFLLQILHRKVQVWDAGWLTLCNSDGSALTTGAFWHGMGVGQ